MKTRHLNPNRLSGVRRAGDIFLIVTVTVMLTVGAWWSVSRTPVASASLNGASAAAPTQTDQTRARALVDGIDSMLVIGDGTTRVGGLEPPWPVQLAAKRGWQLDNLARAGTGFNVGLVGADCPVEPCPSFLGSIVTALEAGVSSPDLIIVSGGGWDGLQEAPMRQAAVATFFAALRANYRPAGIIALEPMWLDEPLPASLRPVSVAVREQVTKVGGAFVEVGAPFQDPPDDVDPAAFNDQANLAVVEAIESYLDELAQSSP